MLLLVRRVAHAGDLHFVIVINDLNAVIVAAIVVGAACRWTSVSLPLGAVVHVGRSVTHRYRHNIDCNRAHSDPGPRCSY